MYVCIYVFIFTQHCFLNVCSHVCTCCSIFVLSKPFPLLSAVWEDKENVQLSLSETLRVTQHAAGLYYFPFGSLKHNYILTSSQP